MPHTIDIKIRGYHLDGYGHVNNARYLEFLEEARWSILEERIDLKGFMERGFLFVIVNININYRRAAYMDDVLRIETALHAISSHSAVIEQTVRLKGTETVVADARITFVILDNQALKPLKLEGELFDILSRMK